MYTLDSMMLTWERREKKNEAGTVKSCYLSIHVIPQLTHGMEWVLVIFPLYRWPKNSMHLRGKILISQTECIISEREGRKTCIHIQCRIIHQEYRLIVCNVGVCSNTIIHEVTSAANRPVSFTFVICGSSR